MSSLDAIDFVALEGGGVKGLAYVPILERLTDLKAVAGTSAGALSALLLALKMPPESIRKVVTEVNWSEWAAGNPKWRAWRTLFPRWGMFSSKRAKEWIIEMLWYAQLPADITMRELYEFSGVALYVTTSSYNRCRAELWGPDSRAKVVDCVLASMSIPYFYPAQMIFGSWHYDGGVTWNHPIDVFRKEDPEKVLGVRVDEVGAEGIEVDGAPGPIKLGMSILRMAMTSANKAHVSDTLWPRIIQIYSDVPATRFDLTEEDIESLLGAGEAALEDWFQKQ